MGVPPPERYQRACHHRRVSATSDLAELLRTMAPRAHPEPYAFVALGEDDPLERDAFAIVREAEGPGALVPLDAARRAGREASFVAAGITLSVHSDLAAVGLTAAVATRLARAGIACNVVAGLRHDHLFVPWEAREAALAALLDPAG
jgi:hypothetical protein